MRFEHPTLLKVASAHKREPAQILLRWGFQHVSVKVYDLYELLFLIRLSFVLRLDMVSSVVLSCYLLFLS